MKILELFESALNERYGDLGDSTCYNGFVQQTNSKPVSSSGNQLEQYEKQIGRSFEAMHDQTGKSKGLYKLVNVVVLKDGEIIGKANETGLKAKASLSVFK